MTSLKDNNDKKGNNKVKINYYSVNGHRFVLLVWLLLSFIICLFILPWLLRVIYWLYDKYLWADKEATVTYGIDALPDFLGGLFGIVIGFFIDSTIISRWQHLKRYQMLLDTMWVELKEIKKEFNKNYDDKIDNFIKLCRAVCPDGGFEEIKTIIRHYDGGQIEKFKKLYDYLEGNGCVFSYKASEIELNDARKELIAVYYQYLKLEDYTIEMPILDDIINSAEDLYILHNLPRYFFWTEKGKLAKQVILIHKHIKDWNEKILCDSDIDKCYADERLLLRREILLEIIDFENATIKKNIKDKKQQSIIIQ